MTEVTIRRIRSADAGRARALRLEMLADTPLAFLTTLAQAAEMAHDTFIERATRGSAGPGTGHFVAESSGRLVGQLVGMPSATDPAMTMLYAVYVAPRFRGRGIIAGLVDACGAWSRECGRDRICLEVITTNERAAKAYRKIGFVAVGDPAPHPSIATLTEQMMVRAA